NARFIKPLDTAMLDQLFNTGKPIVTVEEAALAGGFGSAVIEYAHDVSSNVSISRIGIPDEFVEHGSVEKLLEEIDFTAENVVRTMELAVKGLTHAEREIV
ncbi:MAG TPA: transketolase C-terminal domain-containing protein, partial [Sporosarcina sp.]|nr:transketolase C-terminal domain-containing protein [Sporosarcina sp.]